MMAHDAMQDTHDMRAVSQSLWSTGVGRRVFLLLHVVSAVLFSGFSGGALLVFHRACD